MTPHPTSRAAVVARIKREILQDVAAGVLPGMPATFAELHDYVDANTYGGLCDVHANIDTDELITIQYEVEDWLIQEAHPRDRGSARRPTLTTVRGPREEQPRDRQSGGDSGTRLMLSSQVASASLPLPAPRLTLTV